MVVTHTELGNFFYMLLPIDYVDVQRTNQINRNYHKFLSFDLQKSTLVIVQDLPKWPS